jgi:DNA invertase Pin-like site-specific DNA recombinase
VVRVKVAGYVRISKDTPDTRSPERQREKIEALCRDRGWDLLDTYQDIDQSAFNGHKRPEYERMLSRLEDYGAIVFWRPERLARSVTDFANLLDLCQDKGVALVSTDYPIDTSSAMGKAFVQITSVFAELESGTISERSRQMMAHKKKNEEWVGRVPFGWKLVGKHLEQDKSEQKILEDVARRYISGESFNSIAKSIGMAPFVVTRMMASERVHDALPDDLAGPLAEALLARQYRRGTNKHQTLLGGIARCAICGGTMTSSSTRGNREGTWRSYRCPEPGHVGIASRWLDQFVTEKVLDYIDVDKLMAARKRKKTQTRKASTIEARLEHLNARYVEGKVRPADFDRMSGALLDQLKEAQQAERANGVDLPAELARNLAENWPTMALETRRRIIQAVTESVVVSKSKGNGPIDPSRVRITWRS